MLWFGRITYGYSSKGALEGNMSKFFETLLFQNEADCGLKRSKRIINGEPASIHSYPFLASLKLIKSNQSIKGEHFCTGALIHENYVMTAAHCLHGKKPQDLLIVFGLHRLDDTENSTSVINRRAIKLIVHENFYLDSVFNDIGLIKLNVSVKSSKHISKICLPKPFDSKLQNIDSYALVAGWDKRNSLALQQTWLKVADAVTALDEKICRKYIKKLPDNYTNYFYCAFGTKSNGCCMGDSGTPLLLVINQKHYVYGLLSFVLAQYEESKGSVDCISSAPSYFIKLAPYYEWLAKKMSDL
jgi:secreted trypsin-like serine protease